MCKTPEAGRRMACLRNQRPERLCEVRQEQRQRRQSCGRGRTRLGGHVGTLPRGEHGRVLSRRNRGSQTSLLPSLRSAPSPPPAPCSLRVPPPRAPGPHARPAHRSSGLRPVAHPQQHPFPDAATAIFRSPPGTAHARRARGRREMESAQQAEPAPTSSRASGLPPPPRRLRAALRFLPSNVVPSGKCSPSAEARDGTGERVLGNGVPWVRVPGRLVVEGVCRVWAA